MVTLRILLKRFCGDSGAEFVEFALAFPLLLLVTLGIMDFGILLQQYQVITAAAREGARVGILPNYTTANAEARALAYINASIISMGATTPAPTAAVNPATAVGANCMSTITVTTTFPHTYVFVGGIMNYFGTGLGTKTLTATATMRTESTIGTCP
jgi:Flp pilus assembly protein TadG